jgi:hypothetical protein
MEYLGSILWLFSWPILIYVTYKICVFTVKLFEKNNTGEEV